MQTPEETNIFERTHSHMISLKLASRRSTIQKQNKADNPQMGTQPFVWRSEKGTLSSMGAEHHVCGTPHDVHQLRTCQCC